MITELYVPRPLLADFLAAAARDMRALEADIVYGTVRLIERDDESFLAWAREPWACVVLNLHVEHTPAGIEHAAVAFRRLIDLALERGGSFYLTYHRWATRRNSWPPTPSFPRSSTRSSSTTPASSSRATGTAGSAQRSSWRRPRDLRSHRSRLDLPRRRAPCERERIAGVDALVARPRRGSGPVVVFANAATPHGVEQPAVGRFLSALAGAGFVAVAPELPNVREGEVTPETIDALVGVAGAAGPRVALIGASTGAGLAILAAGDPRLASRVTAVAAIGPFASLRNVLQLAHHGVLRRSPLPGRAAARPAAARSLAASAPDDPAVPALLANRNPRRFDELYDALAPETRALVWELSPLARIGDVLAPD